MSVGVASNYWTPAQVGLHDIDCLGDAGQKTPGKIIDIDSFNMFTLVTKTSFLVGEADDTPAGTSSISVEFFLDSLGQEPLSSDAASLADVDLMLVSGLSCDEPIATFVGNDVFRYYSWGGWGLADDARATGYSATVVKNLDEIFRAVRYIRFNHWLVTPSNYNDIVDGEDTIDAVVTQNVYLIGKRT